MAIIRPGMNKEYYEEILSSGVVTETEFTDRSNQHLGTYHRQGDTGWKDNIIPFERVKTGELVNSPLWVDTGNGLYGYMFSDEEDNEIFADFHINHDYKENSPIFPHIHWIPLSTSTGNVRWEISYVIAKGHQQNESLTEPLSTIILDVNGKGVVGEHFVTEVTELQTFTCSEADIVVRVRVRRLGTDAADTFYGGVVGLMIDFHYQSDKDFTYNKAPNFYTEIQ